MIEIIPNFHPALVHFPIALTTAALAFTAIGTLFWNRSYAAQCRTAGRWMLWAAALSALMAAAFGWFASNSVAHDEVSHAAMMLHRNWALGTLTALLVLAAWDWWRGRFGRMPSQGFLGLLVAAWLLVTSTAWHGAELVYRHGLGVMSIPKPERSGHAHDHGEDHGGMSVQSKGMPHDDGHTHSRDGTADGASTAPKKPGHAHAPGVPPHKD